MKASETNLLRFLQGPKQFHVPIFQRRHSWEKRHCEQLWNDVLRVAEDKDARAHFLGSIVSMQHGIFSASAVSQLLVIDGQQRLTTLSLLLSALGRAIKAQKVDIGIDQSRIQDYYLFNAYEEGELRYKQLLTRHDKETLIQLLEGRDLPANPSHLLVENYRFFEGQLKRAALEAVYKGIEKLIIVDISLDRDYDNPQLIFESLNSTGLALSQADLIRNYVLMGQEPNFQNRLYEDYWFPMEGSFGEEYTERFDRFIRNYLTLKTRRIPTMKGMKGVYNSFKAHIGAKKSQEELEEIIKDIQRYSRHYVRIVSLKEADPELRASLEDLRDLNVEVVFPFLLEVYDDYTQERIEKTEVIEILRLIESYIFRLAICGIRAATFGRLFATLGQKVDKSNYLESLKTAFSLMPPSQRYPSNTEFQRRFLTADVYNFDKRNYLLRKLENYGRKEPIRVEDYTIERVMPETLTKEWREDLGENWKEVHEKYLHTIGNLTLTGYNSELSNRSFADKRDRFFSNSPLHLNQSLAQAERWDETAIVNRGEQLFQEALKIWIDLGVQREEQENYDQKKGKDYTLADHRFLTGKMLELFQQLHSRIQALDSVGRKILKTYITYKTRDTVFVSIKPQKKRLLLVLNLPFSEIDDPQELCDDVTNRGTFRTGDVQVGLSNESELDYIMFLIRQVFEKQIADQ